MQIHCKVNSRLTHTHLSITDTLIIRKAATSRGKKNCRRLTEINSHYYGLSLMRTLTQGPHSVAWHSSFNPFIARVNVGVPKGSLNFWVCGQNPMMWPFKWNLSACSFKRRYLFSKFYKTKFGNFCWILPLNTLGTERVNEEEQEIKMINWRTKSGSWTVLRKSPMQLLNWLSIGWGWKR